MAWQVKDNDDANEARLLHEIAHLQRKLFDRRAQHLGLTRSQWRVLGIVRRQPGIRQAQLADHMEIEPITLVRLLDRMMKTGWIERRADPRDRRANQIFLTDKVKDIVVEMRRLALGLRRDALKGFSARDHAQLLGYLVRIKANSVAALDDEETS